MTASPNARWWPKLDSYQKLVFVVATLAWMFDCLDQQLFNLARGPAMAALLEPGKDAKWFGGLATSIFMIGWATGGMIFGSLGDRFGRARMLGITVLLYSLATGLSALSVHFIDFAIYRFITGLGVGGVFGLSVALVADTVPNDVRPRALGVLQSFSAVGNIMAGSIGMAIPLLHFGGDHYWKWLFLIGAAPAFLTAILQTRMKEPQKWVESKALADSQGKKSGSYRELFGHPKWRKHALLGMILSCAGVVGLWGIGVFSTDLVRDIVKAQEVAKGAAPEVIKHQQDLWGAINLTCFNVGAFLGMLAFTKVAQHLPRKKTFVIFFIGALVSTVFVFQNMRSMTSILWMAPLMGFFQLSVFAGFSIYLPELFPTRLRSTGTSFCYNIGRYLAATAPFTLAVLNQKMADQSPSLEAKINAFGNAASMMCAVFLLALFVLPFLPETKGQPLPEE